MAVRPTPKNPWPDDDHSPLSDELLEVRRRRYKEARNAGLSLIEAALFADSSIDIGELRRLVRDGCDPGLIVRILL